MAQTDEKQSGVTQKPNRFCKYYFFDEQGCRYHDQCRFSHDDQAFEAYSSRVCESCHVNQPELDHALCKMCHLQTRPCYSFIETGECEKQNEGKCLFIHDRSIPFAKKWGYLLCAENKHYVYCPGSNSSSQAQARCYSCLAEQPCVRFSKTGHCKYGDQCWMSHADQYRPPLKPCARRQCSNQTHLRYCADCHAQRRVNRPKNQ